MLALPHFAIPPPCFLYACISECCAGMPLRVLATIGVWVLPQGLGQCVGGR